MSAIEPVKKSSPVWGTLRTLFLISPYVVLLYCLSSYIAIGVLAIILFSCFVAAGLAHVILSIAAFPEVRIYLLERCSELLNLFEKQMLPTAPVHLKQFLILLVAALRGLIANVYLDTRSEGHEQPEVIKVETDVGPQYEEEPVYPEESVVGHVEKPCDPVSVNACDSLVSSSSTVVKFCEKCRTYYHEGNKCECGPEVERLAALRSRKDNWCSTCMSYIYGDGEVAWCKCNPEDERKLKCCGKCFKSYEHGKLVCKHGGLEYSPPKYHCKTCRVWYLCTQEHDCEKLKNSLACRACRRLLVDYVKPCSHGSCEGTVVCPNPPCNPVVEKGKRKCRCSFPDDGKSLTICKTCKTGYRGGRQNCNCEYNPMRKCKNPACKVGYVGDTKVCKC